MKKATLSTALLIAMFAASASAQPMPSPGPGGPPPAPTSEELATVPNLSAAEQIELHKILIQRRDAHEAVHEKARAELDALHKTERSEQERVDEQASGQARKLLGEDKYRRFAEWDLAHRGPPGAGPGMHPPMRSRGEQGEGPDRDAPPHHGDASRGRSPGQSRD